jgi:hypothetical protein
LRVYWNSGKQQLIFFLISTFSEFFLRIKKSYLIFQQTIFNILSPIEEAAAESSIMIDETDGVLEDDEAAKGLTDKFKKSIEHRESSRRRRLNKGFNRLKDNATLADNTKILQDVWFRRNRSRVYIYLVPLISIFYFVPAIQFAFQVCFYQFSAF